ncbi:hypothetical protein P8C59_007852 [Phyllachora maydis]|uniref:Uncharacterized protein n=1 Tax=Phyllachora maydis TaxID=1825666 RepID=A0AAD9MEL7_9PEZI|nr:hypothetical protein P8C59_007852 [Phyllachora maydis]
MGQPHTHPNGAAAAPQSLVTAAGSLHLVALFMRFSAATLLGLVGSALAQTNGFDAMSKPAKDEKVPAGSTYPITWCSRPSRVVWTRAPASTAVFQYSFPFHITGLSSSSTSHSAPWFPTASTTATSSVSSSVSAASSSASSSTYTFTMPALTSPFAPISSTFAVILPTALAGNGSAGNLSVMASPSVSQTTVTGTDTGSKTGSTGSTTSGSTSSASSAPSSGAGPRVAGSLAALAGVMAVFAL